MVGCRETVFVVVTAAREAVGWADCLVSVVLGMLDAVRLVDEGCVVLDAMCLSNREKQSVCVHTMFTQFSAHREYKSGQFRPTILASVHTVMVAQLALSGLLTIAQSHQDDLIPQRQPPSCLCTRSEESSPCMHRVRALTAQ